MLKPIWIVAIWLLLAPLTAAAAPTLQSICQGESCALMTAGTEPAPSSLVQLRAAHLRSTNGWASIRPGRVVVPDKRNEAPFRATHRRAVLLAREGQPEAALRILNGEFFSVLPSIAHWQDEKLQRIMETLCHELITMTPASEERLVVARTCLVHLPNLYLQVLEGGGPAGIKDIYIRALDGRARGHLELSTDSDCEIAVGGIRTPAPYFVITDPLRGTYNVVVKCKDETVLYHVDAYSTIADGTHKLYFAGNARQRLQTPPSQIPHLRQAEWRIEDVHREARTLLIENKLTAIVLVHAQPELVTEVIRPTSSVFLSNTPGSASPRVPPDLATKPKAGTRTYQAAALVLGSTSVALTASAWALTVWSGARPVQEFIDSAADPNLTQKGFDDLERRWMRSRATLHALGASSSALATVALVLGRQPLRRLPRWSHWLVGTVGLALATTGIVETLRASGCTSADPRACADETFRFDRGMLLTYTGIPLLAEPLVVAPWRQTLSWQTSKNHVSLHLGWSL